MFPKSDSLFPWISRETSGVSRESSEVSRDSSEVSRESSEVSRESSEVSPYSSEVSRESPGFPGKVPRFHLIVPKFNLEVPKFTGKVRRIGLLLNNVATKFFPITSLVLILYINQSVLCCLHPSFLLLHHRLPTSARSPGILESP
jgi:hypothetical protein